MKTIKNLLSALTIAIIPFQSSLSQSTNTLWYSQPAEHFEECLVLGNGKMGATVFGGVSSDKIYLNDITLWSGEPVNPNMNPDAHTFIPAIREALKNEDYQLADELNRKVQGSFSQSYAPLGTMYIDFGHSKEATKYRRELDISRAVSRISYSIDGVTYTREYFISHPDKVMAIKLSCSKKNRLNFDIRLESLLNHQTTTGDNTLVMKGNAPVRAEPNYRQNVENAVAYDSERGTRFTAKCKIKSKDGKVVATDSTIGLRAGSEAIIYIAEETSFNGFDKNPAQEGKDEHSMVKGSMDLAIQKSYDRILEDHLNDYQSFFSRVELDLGKTDAPDLPTDQRLLRYAEGHEDKNLEILYFQFGRYLLISSSRTEGVPANLQGLWNPYLRPPWSSNYTININAEENYWLAENANLSEMHSPMLTFIGNIAQTGAVTARTFYGVGGWAACHNSDIWAMSNPVGNFGEGNPVWANWNMGGTWLSTHLWEHYIFTSDIEFLQSNGYPLMKGAAQFCLEWMVEDAEGKLITSPSTSPENVYLTDEGYRGATFYGGTGDLAMIRECFQQTIKASEILDIDPEFRESLKKALERLHPYQVGKKGNLQEWYYDWEDSDPKHRHQTHLFGLYPGHQITPEKTPELAAACRQTLEIKGDETTGWSKGWRINLWARLWDGNRAYKMYRELLRYVKPDGIRENYENGGGTYPNLFDAHPPFQIDGNFGGAAAVVEMLLQSDVDEIRLLPALPDAWNNGSVKGLKARGGFEISMIWSDMILKNVTIRSPEGGETKLIYDGMVVPVVLMQGESLTINWKK